MRTIRTAEELNAEAFCALPKWYMSLRQLERGLRKRPTWYGGRLKSGGYYATLERPAGPCYRLVRGELETITAGE